eukprot:TRINITY_DN25602_c0_g1_i1.p1 TRINITY_DN25602_c0_g1~~TRINITY_DN25602_c0_g1_i1.p1  ORF type:complete len:112 (-),score=33.34 TRINITY_DN25602_c0_g1_i1:59-394(-)
MRDHFGASLVMRSVISICSRAVSFYGPSFWTCRAFVFFLIIIDESEEPEEAAQDEAPAEEEVSREDVVRQEEAAEVEEREEHDQKYEEEEKGEGRDAEGAEAVVKRQRIFF